MTDIDLGNMYDINKTIIKQTEKALSSSKVTEVKKETVIPYFRKKVQGGAKYFMLLCNERKDYTLFRFLHSLDDIIPDTQYAGAELILCLKNRGDIYSIANTEDGIALEIWLSIDDEIYCYYLFPYDEGVIEID